MKSFALYYIACACVAASAQAQAPQPSSPRFALKEVVPTLPTKEPMEVRVRPNTLQPGLVGAWHTHQSPPIIYVLEGTFMIEFKNGEIQQTEAGKVVVEPINTVMRAVNKTQTPTKVIIFMVAPPEMPESLPAN